MNDNKRGLGRGLAALIPTNAPTRERVRPGPVDAYFPVSREAPAPAAEPADSPRGDFVPPVVSRHPASKSDSVVETITRVDGASTAASSAQDGIETTDPGELLPISGMTVAEIPLDSIRPNPQQPRQVFDEAELAELSSSIATVGLLQPIVVRPVPGTDQAGGTAPTYELIMGERRWRACRQAQLTVVPAIVRQTDDEDMLRDALLENLHRAQLNPLEEAAAYRQLLDDFGCTHEVLATRLSRSRPQVTNTLRLLRLPPLVQRRVAAGVLSAGHARALLGLGDSAAIERLAQRIVAEGLSVRSVEEIVALGPDGGESGPRTRSRTPIPLPENATALAARLTDTLDTSVKVSMGKSKGKLTIEFASAEDLERIADVLGLSLTAGASASDTQDAA